MPLPRLDNLVSIGSLKAEPADPTELAGLIHSGRARLKDAAIESLSIESRFDLAYNANHALALAALRFHGYRSENRYVVFQVLEDTVGLPKEQWRVLDQAHKKRNQIEYGGTDGLDLPLVEAMIRVGREIERLVLALHDG
jgi:hypothetical protein